MPVGADPLYPGSSIRLSVSAIELGAPKDPQTLTCRVYGPKGSGVVIDLTSSIVRDAQGFYHADGVLPADAPTGPGPWKARWTATGPTPDSNAVAQEFFPVRVLGDST